MIAWGVASPQLGCGKPPENFPTFLQELLQRKLKYELLVCLCEKWEKGKPNLSLLLILLHA
jgi:hypothetical protein